MVRPATPGTIVVLAATILLVMVSVSSPIVKSIYFLSADLGVSVGSVSLNGQVKLGVFGYCVDGIGNEAVCQGPQLGYELDSDQVFGNTSGLVSLPNSLIKWLTYALIIHPIAAGLAGLSFLLGLLSHFREMSTSKLTTCVASTGATVSMLAFIFDIVLFTIARSRINSASTSDVSVSASYGNAIWLTLAGFLLLAISGCFFGFGHCCISRRPRQEEKERYKPKLDPNYLAEVRKDATDYEKAEADRRRNGNGSGLPAFHEEESTPLTNWPRLGSVESFQDPDQSVSSIQGVGTGYGRGPGAPPTAVAAGVSPPRRQGSSNVSRAEPFVSMYDQSARQDTQTPGAGSRIGQPNRQGSGGTDYSRQQGYSYGGQYPNTSGSQVSQSLPQQPLQMPVPQAYGSQAGGGGYRQNSRSDTYPPVESADYNNSAQHYGQQNDAYYNQSQYPSHQQYPSRQGSGNQYESQQANSAPVTLPSGEGGFYQAAQSQRYNSNESYPSHAAPRQQPSTNYYAQPDTQQRIASPDNLYDSYYQTQQQGERTPSSIPYLRDGGETPTPTYNSRDAYPSYGGNAYR